MREPWREYSFLIRRRFFLQGLEDLTSEERAELEQLERVAARVADAVASLPEREAVVFFRVCLEGESVGAVASDLGVSARWCRELAGRGGEKVEKILFPNGYTIQGQKGLH